MSISSCLCLNISKINDEQTGRIVIRGRCSRRGFVRLSKWDSSSKKVGRIKPPAPPKYGPDNFKMLHYQQSSYLAEILPRYTPSRSLRSSASTTISVPLRKTSMVSSKSFSSVASNIRNKLPGHMSSVSTLPAFRKHLKYHLFLQTYNGSITPSTLIAFTSNIMPST